MRVAFSFTNHKKAAEHVALRSFCDKAGQEPPLGLNTSALTRKEGDPEKRRSIFSGRGGAAASMRRKQSARRGEQSQRRRRDQEVVGSSPVTSTMIADEKAAK